MPVRELHISPHYYVQTACLICGRNRSLSCLQNVQTSYGSHSAFSSVDPAVSFQEYCIWSKKLSSYPCLMLRSKMSGARPHIYPYAFILSTGQIYRSEPGTSPRSTQLLVPGVQELLPWYYIAMFTAWWQFAFVVLEWRIRCHFTSMPTSHMHTLLFSHRGNITFCLTYNSMKNNSEYETIWHNFTSISLYSLRIKTFEFCKGILHVVSINKVLHGAVSHFCS